MQIPANHSLKSSAILQVLLERKLPEEKKEDEQPLTTTNDLLKCSKCGKLILRQNMACHLQFHERKCNICFKVVQKY